MAWRGWTEKFEEHLDAEGKSGETGAAYILFGKIGYIAKGIAIAHRRRPVRLRRHHPRARRSPAASTRRCARCCSSRSGQLLLVVIAVGIGCYGLFCFARARHLSR